jgi:hypothetical protein
MQRDEYGVRLSASDLMRFAGCAHATRLDLGRLDGHGSAPAADSADAALLQRHGDAHEARHLARLRAAGRSSRIRAAPERAGPWRRVVVLRSDRHKSEEEAISQARIGARDLLPAAKGAASKVTQQADLSPELWRSSSLSQDRFLSAGKV